MSKNFWLLKSEPEEWSWQQQVKSGNKGINIGTSGDIILSSGILNTSDTTQSGIISIGYKDENNILGKKSYTKTPIFYIKQDGNVSIGTTDSDIILDNKLTVDGSMRINGNLDMDDIKTLTYNSL